jgi:hypothetical protein
MQALEQDVAGLVAQQKEDREKAEGLGRMMAEVRACVRAFGWERKEGRTAVGCWGGCSKSAANPGGI